MSALLPLRDYQAQAIRAIHTKWYAGVTRPATVLPTGAGKTVVFAHLAEQFLAANVGRRVLVLAHTDELVNQAAKRIRDVAPHRSIGIVKAAQNEVHTEIVVASVQTLARAARRDQIRNVGLIIVDECHHATARTYRNILEHFGAFTALCAECIEASDQVSSDAGRRVWPSYCPTGDCATNRTVGGPIYTAGFTATLVRGDKAKLSDVWEDVAFRLSIAFMIRSGYLLDVRGKRVEVPEFDLGQVKKSGGDYAEGSLGEALIEAFAPEIVAKAYVEQAGDRKGIGFAPTIDAAYAFAEAFADQGIKTEVVHGHTAERPMPIEERRAILRRLHDGATQVVWSVMALTEGFDEPTVSCAVIARPTRSAGLYQQMVGRVLRPDLSLAPDDRGHALILDVVGISRKHDLRSLVDLSTREDLPENPDEDLSLLELEDLIVEDEELESSGAGLREPEGYYVGPAETREFDPLGRDSDRTWGQTPDGTYYLAAGTAGYVFLADSMTGDPGTYDVVWCTKSAAGFADRPRGLSFEMAIAWGEEEAIERGGHGTATLTAKKARWRKDPATSGQVTMVRRAGVKVEELEFAVGLGESYRIEYRVDGERLTKGRASEIIDAHMAAKRIDPLVAAVKAARQ